MKSWLRHFILGIVIGTVSISLMYTLLNSVPGHDEDSNLLVTLFVILAYGVGTTILGEILLGFGRKK
ncbi:MAG: hypothetical protein K0S20_512 [Patescibacteria group bacterium]|nr:hypothetical protein [Patescibacteria group bacterium]